MTIYTRGQFALIGKVSVKALRIYDEIGLLKPTRIDPDNQYKYYSTEQVDEIVFINELKTFGFSLDEIKNLKANNDSKYLKERFEHRFNQLDSEIKENYRIKNNLAEKIALLNSGIINFQKRLEYKIQTIKWEDMTVVGFRQMANIQDVGRLIGKVYEIIHELSLEAVDSHLIIFHNHEREIQDENGEWDLEVCIPVNKNFNGANYTTKVLEGKTYAKTSQVGGFCDIGKAHAAVIDWIAANNLKICGAPLEKYLTARQAVFNPSSFEIEVYYPIGPLE